MNTHTAALTRGTAAGIGEDDRKMQAGAALRFAMEDALTAKQMSVSALARIANVQRGDIYRWWRGESRPSRNSLARVAAALDVDAAALAGALGAVRPLRSPDPIVAAIEVQTEVLRELTAAITAMLNERVDNPREGGNGRTLVGRR